MRLLAPLFARYGVQGYVEPLGFSISSLRSSLLTQALIRDSGAPYRIVLDTFHHYLSDVTQADFDAQIQVTQIGLVHLSGVEDGRDKGALSDEERIMLSAGDRLESRRQVQNLERLGYTGVYAFEPFSSQLDSWSEADIERKSATASPCCVKTASAEAVFHGVTSGCRPPAGGARCKTYGRPYSRR